MNMILSKNINDFLYNHQIPKDFSYFIQSLLITELGLEMKMRQENSKELQENLTIYGKTYPIHEVLFNMTEYIKFIILNNSRGNYDIKRGFEYDESITNNKEDYCLYLKYIFDSMGINLDYIKIQEQLGKRRIIKGDSRYGNLVYEFLQDSIFKEMQKIKQKGWIELGADTIYLTEYPNDICTNLEYEKNGVNAYYGIPNEYKGIYNFMKELNNLHSIKNINNYKMKIMEYNQNLNLYYDLWFTTKYARAQNRKASKEELKEIKTEYEKFYINKGIKEIKSLEEKKKQFIQKSYEITEYEI